MSDLQITNVQLLEGGVEIGYMRLPKDLRKNGLMWSHSLLIPRGSDYDDELDAFEEALQALLVDALDDEDTAESVDPIEEDEEDDE